MFFIVHDTKSFMKCPCSVTQSSEKMDPRKWSTTDALSGKIIFSTVDLFQPIPVGKSSLTPFSLYGCHIPTVE